MLTSLPKHRGAHGPIIAFFLLVTTTIVVIFTQPRKPPTIHEDALPRPVVAAPDPLPAASVPAPAPVPRPTETAATKIVSGTGIIGYDETKTSHLWATVPGWLDKTRVKSLGRTIRAGETLGVIYSVDVYLTSVDVLARIKQGPSAELDGARTQLLRWGMPPWTLTKMQQSGVPERSVPLIARVNGKVVAEQNAKLVDPADDIELFTITDPTRYWLYVEVPADDAARVKVGASAAVALDTTERPIAGRVGYVYRRVEGGMRSVRIEIQSRKPLRIGSTATAEIKL